MSNKTHRSRTTGAITCELGLFVTSVGAIPRRTRTDGTLKDFGVRISELNGNVALEFVLESDGLHPRNGLDDCGFTVRDVSDCA